MFEAFGLGTAVEREHFNRLAALGANLRGDSELHYELRFDNSSVQTGVEHETDVVRYAELARDTE